MNLAQEIRQIVVKNLETPESDLTSGKFLIVYDLQTEIAQELFKAYSEVLPGAKKISFYDMAPEVVIAEVSKCAQGDLVVLIQSSSFRMSNFRWRLELFNRKLRVIEHAHLISNLPEETPVYLETLKYDGDYYEQVVSKFKPVIESSQKIVLRTGDGLELVYEGGVEKVKKNTGDFSGLANKGCGYPIGEMFTEPLDLEKVNGKVQIFAFADTNHRVIFPAKPFVLEVKNGRVKTVDGIFSAEDKIEKFRNSDDSKALSAEGKWLEVMNLIATENPDGEVRMRELGFGLNRALSKTRRLTDISAYERVSGVHISLGLKHDIYRDKVSKEKTQRFHVDIFPDIFGVLVDGENIFLDGKYLI